MNVSNVPPGPATIHSVYEVFAVIVNDSFIIELNAAGVEMLLLFRNGLSVMLLQQHDMQQ